MLIHAQISVYQDSQVFFRQSAFQVSEIVSLQMQDFTSLFAFLEVHVILYLQSFEVHLDDKTSLWILTKLHVQ